MQSLIFSKLSRSCKHCLLLCCFKSKMEGGGAQPWETGPDPGPRNSCSDTPALWAFSAGGWAGIGWGREHLVPLPGKQTKVLMERLSFTLTTGNILHKSPSRNGCAARYSTERKLSITSPDSVTQGNPLIPLFFLQMKSFHPVNSIPSSHSGRNHLPQWNRKIWNSSNVCCILLLFVRTCSSSAGLLWGRIQNDPELLHFGWSTL